MRTPPARVADDLPDRCLPPGGPGCSGVPYFDLEQRRRYVSDDLSVPSPPPVCAAVSE